MDVDQRVDRYIVVRLLGQGGMGSVYAARDPELDRMVALKVLRADAAGKATQHERLRREAQAMAQLSHPNVVAIHDVGTANGQIFIAMEYVEGLTLATWLAALERTPGDIIAHFVEAARGLSAAHHAGLVHRDFKPENVLVGSDGRVRVTDFGLARSIDHAPPTAAERITRDFTVPSPDAPPVALTATGTVVGTPLYMAPEQYRGELADARTDQFAFCVALHAALYRERPFAGDTYEQLAQAVLSGKRGPTPELAGVSAAQRAAIVRGMSLAPAERFPSIDALIDALEPPPVAAATPRARRRLLARAVIAGIAIGAAATAVILVGKMRGGGGKAGEPSFCEHDLAGVWDGDRRAAIARAIGDSKVASAASTAQRVLAAGDRFSEAWLGRRDTACRAVADKTLGQDAFALAQMCLTLRRADAKAVFDRLAATPSPSEVGHAIDAVTIGGGPPLAVCDDREYLRVLVGPPDAKTRAAINAVLRPLHELRAQLALGDVSAGRAAAAAQLPAVRGFELPAVRAEVILVAAELAFADEDLPSATALVAEAVNDAQLGRHDLVEAQARIDQLAIAIASGAEVVDANVEAARSAVARVQRRRELDAALASVEGALAAKRGDLAKARDRYVDAEHAADGPAGLVAPTADPLGAAPRLALATALVAGRAGAEAVAAAQDAVAYRERAYGADHPRVASALLVLGDAQRDTQDLSAAFASYTRAETLATDEPATRAEALARQATIAGTGEAVKLVTRALALDAMALRADHPQAVRHRGILAALQKQRDAAP